MTTRPLRRPDARLLNHVEFVYAPGDRRLTRRFLEALGLRVLDPQVDAVPAALGPAAGPYLIVFVDGDEREDDLIDNVLYASEAGQAQWKFESALQAQLRRVSEVFEPGDPGSVDDRVVQAFVYTDLISVGLLCSGQQIELQVRLDGV